MKTKIMGILVCMLLIATAFPAVGTLNIDDMSNSPQPLSYVEWEHTYGGDEFDWFYDIQPTSDDGYVAAGITEEDNMFYAWIQKVYADGEEEWSSVNYDFNGSEIDVEVLVDCVRETPDGGYLVGGFGWSYYPLYEVWVADGLLWKVNATGDTMWLNFIGNETEGRTYVAENIIVVDDGYICGGFSIHYSPTYDTNIALFKTDFDGNLLWNKTYNAGGHEWARSLWMTEPDNGFFLSGTTGQNPSTDDDAYIMVKTDSGGTKEWDAIFDGPLRDYSPTSGCRQTAEGGYLMAGISSSYGAGMTDLWIVKTDADGNLEWDKTYGGPNNDRCYGMDGTVDGGYVFSCIHNAYYVSGTNDDTWLIITDAEGNPEWEYLREEPGIQWTQPIVQTEDEGFIIAGRNAAWQSPTADGLIMKIGPLPHIDIEVAGGLGVEATLTNNGLGDAVQAPYEITVTGGLLGLINKTVTGTIDLEAGATESISSGLLLGLGKIEITVKIGVKVETFEGRQFLIFSLI